MSFSLSTQVECTTIQVCARIPREVYERLRQVDPEKNTAQLVKQAIEAYTGRGEAGEGQQDKAVQLVGRAR